MDLIPSVDDSPLDPRAQFDEFMEACRRGDLRTCQEMIDEDVNVNGADSFDYTPLIVASICGHYDIVLLLLESGAVAERGTFQGQRCIYGALTLEIRNLLLEYDYSKAADPLLPWSTHIQSLFARQTPKTSDISVNAGSGSHSFDLHKFILLIRATHFWEFLTFNPDVIACRIPDFIPGESAKHVLGFLYLTDPPSSLGDPYTSAHEKEVACGIVDMCTLLEIEAAGTILSTHTDPRVVLKKHQEEVNRAHRQLEDLFHEYILENKFIIHADTVQDVKHGFNDPLFTDVILSSEENQDSGQVTLYPVHKAILIRCPYFETMFSSSFAEAQESDYLIITKLHCCPEALEVIITYLYTEKFQCPIEIALEVLYTADMLMFEPLKTKAAVAISNLGGGTTRTWVERPCTTTMISGDDAGNKISTEVQVTEKVEVEPVNIYDIMRAAWDLRVRRLEEFAAKYLAHRLEDYIDEEEFAELIAESASRVRDREATDTIELLDDIRHYLSERFRMRFEDTGLADVMNGVAQVEIDTGDATGEGGGEVIGDGKGIGGEQENGEEETKNGPPDEFDSDAANYRILLQKIDSLLDRLKLGA